ncbi:MAG: hypothetical protein KatS3mg113_0422 [Planctomycetaceae bacterium]|nr:MAG: hypothetical protein KatS3mg113_0422 [Planctomycetaceae bacterium]
MIQIQHQNIPQTLLYYVAFRTALRTTWDQLSQVVAGHTADEETTGFISEVPYLCGVPLHVQLFILAKTWDKHRQRVVLLADVLDEYVLYACCESTIRHCREAPSRINWALRGGPYDISVPAGEELAQALRRQTEHWPCERELFVLQQLLDLPPDESEQWRQEQQIHDIRWQMLLDVLGNWWIPRGWNLRLQGLATVDEIDQLGKLTAPWMIQHTVT